MKPTTYNKHDLNNPYKVESIDIRIFSRYNKKEFTNN